MSTKRSVMSSEVSLKISKVAKSDDLALLLAFIKIRRQLNIRAVSLLKGPGIGPKQAILLRELLSLKKASLSTLARVTQTDPAATGKAVDGLIKKGWIERTDHPEDKRRWQVSLSKEGIAGARKIETLYHELAAEFCLPLLKSERKSLAVQFGKISEHLSLTASLMGKLAGNQNETAARLL